MTRQTLYNQTPAALDKQRYPFRDSATMRSTSGVAIATEIFLDARVYAGSQADQYISLIELADTGVRVVVSDRAGPIAAGVWVSGKTIRLLDDLQREVGVLYGNFAGLEGLLSDGPLTFSRLALPFVPSCVTTVGGDGVDALLDQNGNWLIGDVWLVGGPGVRLEVDGNEVRVHIIGDRLFTRRACLANPGETPARSSLKLIEILDADGEVLGTLTPDDHGNVLLLPGDGETAAPGAGQADNPIRITGIANGLQLQMLNTLG
jgi:hypothetical protein